MGRQMDMVIPVYPHSHPNFVKTKTTEDKVCVCVRAHTHMGLCVHTDQSYVFKFTVVCVCVCVCVCLFFHTILFVNCFGRAVLYMLLNIIFRLICIMWVLRALMST